MATELSKIEGLNSVISD